MKIFQLLAILLAGVLVVACGKKEQPVPAEAVACTPQAVTDIASVQLVPGLVSKTLTSGCGDAAETGSVAVVHYTGWLFDDAAADKRGQKFDSSRDRGQHFRFPLGAGRVIKGWDQGVVGMAVGEVRELTVAPALAYGDRDLGIIPPGSTLVFEVELAEIVKPQTAPAEPSTE